MGAVVPNDVRTRDWVIGSANPMKPNAFPVTRIPALALFWIVLLTMLAVANAPSVIPFRAVPSIVLPSMNALEPRLTSMPARPPRIVRPLTVTALGPRIWRVLIVTSGPTTMPMPPPSSVNRSFPGGIDTFS